MKLCRQCNRTYADDTLSFCLEDGSPLSASYDPQTTMRFPSSLPPAENQIVTEVLASNQLPTPAGRSSKYLLFIVIAVMILVTGLGATLLMFKFQNKRIAQSSTPTPIPTISASPASLPSTPSPAITRKTEPRVVKETAKPDENQIVNNNSEAVAGEQISVPKIYGKTYDEARKILINEGWQPDTKPGTYGSSAEIQSGNGPVFWERGYRELVTCSGTGTASCLFEFADPAKRVLVVVTNGEESDQGDYHAQVSRVFFKAK